MTKPIGNCTVPGCERQEARITQGMCNTHYLRWRRTGATDLLPRTKPIRYCLNGCGGKHYARGLCVKCYSVWLRWGDDRPKCSVEGCQRPRYAKGMCIMHGARRREHGTTDLIGQSTTDRFWYKVNKGNSDGCWTWMGACSRGKRAGYGIVVTGHTHVLAHRFSYELAYGPLPPNTHLHHTCHNKTCVNPAHLQPVIPKVHIVETWISTLRTLGYTVTPPS